LIAFGLPIIFKTLVAKLESASLLFVADWSKTTRMKFLVQRAGFGPANPYGKGS